MCLRLSTRQGNQNNDPWEEGDGMLSLLTVLVHVSVYVIGHFPLGLFRTNASKQ